jgi:hypothetical protein
MKMYELDRHAFGLAHQRASGAPHAGGSDMTGLWNFVRRSVFLAVGVTLLLAMQARRVHAQGDFYALIVNGSPSLNVTYDHGYLIVHFRRTLRGAGQPTGYIHNVPPGSAAWVDRPLNDREPLVLRQQMSDGEAGEAVNRLKQSGGYWKFFCRNTGHGYFEVSRSERTNAAIRFDDRQ